MERIKKSERANQSFSFARCVLFDPFFEPDKLHCDFNKSKKFLIAMTQ